MTRKHRQKHVKGCLYYSISNEMRAALRKIPWTVRVVAYRHLKKNPWKLVPDGNEILFIHIPKTGGTAVVRSLGLRAGWHPKLEEFYAYDAIRAALSFKFAFVRNPWDRLVSSFHYTINRSDSLAEARWRDHWLAGCDNFDCFLMRLRDDPRFRRAVLVHPMFEPQVNFVTYKGNVTLDFIGKQESLDDDLRRTFDTINLVETKVEKINTSMRDHYGKYYAEKWQIDLVRRMYKEDIREFDYEFA